MEAGQNAERPDPGDEADRSVNDENMFLAAHFGELHRGWLRDLDAALERVSNGTYGICTTCGDSISDSRLRVLPETATCAGCAEIRAIETRGEKHLRV